MSVIEFLKVLFLGLVEGVTEWLPISSTGHMLLVDELLQLDASQDFKDTFFVVIQLGAILAVVIRMWPKLWPLEARGGLRLKQDVLSTWGKVALACVPGAAAELLLGDYVDAHLENFVTIACALIFYGIVFLVVEGMHRSAPRVSTVEALPWTTALGIGLFQVLALIPGTSRSGATIIGALLLGVSRVAATEFTFLMAVPVMLGMSALKLLQHGLNFSGRELAILALGMVTAFLVSMAVIRMILRYIKTHSFKVFGWYRIALGALVLLYFLVIK